MRKFLTLAVVGVMLAGTTSCAYLGTQTDLKDVAGRVGFSNITTGDGTFENYQAVGHYTGLEFGIAVGIPYLFKIMELYPAASNEDLLESIAQEAKEDGANAMINVKPHSEFYTGFPFMIVGIYFDRTEGTGIKTK